MTNLAVFREIFKECSIFAKKVYTLLNEHEELSSELSKKRKSASSSGVPPGVGVAASAPDTPNSKLRPKKKRKEGPKRPLSSYMLFVQKERPGIVEKNPDAKFTDIGKLLGSSWAKLNDEDKKKYVDMASEDKARYNQELQQYNQHPEHEPMDNDGDASEHAQHDPDVPDGVAAAQLLPPPMQHSQGSERADKEMADSDR